MKLVVLTGAGISAESGLGTFRGAGGIWAKYDLSEVATPEGFSANPAKVHEFYNSRRKNASKANFNAAHQALSDLQARLGNRMILITQNVDSLHEAAGHHPVIHMHGRLDGALCASCDHRWDAPLAMQTTDTCPVCFRMSARPDIVWFGEMPYFMDVIDDALDDATHFAAIGTSGQVYPAAGFVERARHVGAKTFELNLEASGAHFDVVRTGHATTVVPAWCAEILTEYS